jgi:hypothetical protein
VNKISRKSWSSIYQQLEEAEERKRKSMTPTEKDMQRRIDSLEFEMKMLKAKNKYMEGMLEFYKKRVGALQDVEKFMQDWRNEIQ